MAQRIWCRYADCRKPFESVAGNRPDPCPKCGKPQCWSTDQHAPPPAKFKKRARVPFAVTQQDYRLFLKRIGIARE